MTQLIISATTFVAWFAFIFPPLATSRNKAAQTVHLILAGVLGSCIGYSLGHALTEVLLKWS